MKEVQNWIVQNLNTDENTSATIIITFIVLFLGWLATRLSRSFQLIISRHQKRSTIFLILKPFQYSTKKQANMFFEFSKKLNINNNNKLDFKIHEVPECDLFLSVDFESLHQAFLGGIYGLFNRSKKEKLLHNLYRDSKIIKKIESEYPNQLEKFNESFLKYADMRNLSIKQFIKLVDKLYEETINNKNEDIEIFLSEFFNVINKWKMNILLLTFVIIT